MNKLKQTVNGFLSDSKLTIPEYQRPYKWNQGQVTQLLDDIFHFRDKSAFRIGTIVINPVGESHNIVDGQQRTLTFMLIIHALCKRVGNNLREKIHSELQAIKTKMPNLEFTNHISIQNLRQNYQVIKQKVGNWEDNTIDFFLNKCEIIRFELPTISEAFQFFDAQNSRGKELEPHDLLKAFHLREFSQHEANKHQLIQSWEKIDIRDLAGLFAKYLYMIRKWSIGGSARYFSKNNINHFKGINLEKDVKFPFVKPLIAISNRTEQDNQLGEPTESQHSQDFPYQIDQVIINGERFFEMINHYHEQKNGLNTQLKDNLEGNTTALRIINTINDYDGMYRIGDRYVRNIFDCAIGYYMDRFGKESLAQAVEKIFIWAYWVRLEYRAVQLATIDNYVIQYNMIKRIRNAIHPRSVLSFQIPGLNNNNTKKITEIQNLFKVLDIFLPNPES